jgi:hypothetical protein
MVKFILEWQNTEHVKAPRSTLPGARKDKLLPDPLITQKLSELWLIRTG